MNIWREPHHGRSDVDRSESAVMPFAYVDGRLCCDGVDLAQIAA